MADAQDAVGPAGNPVVDVDYSGTTLTVTYADATSEQFTVAGGGGVDQTARDTATAHAADANAHHTPPTGGGTTDQTARDAAATAQTTAGTAQADIDDHEANYPSGGGVDDAAVMALIDVHAGMPNIHHMRGEGGTGVLSVIDGRLPAAPVQARIAWKDASEAVTASSFGADSADAMTDLILIPDYPQAFLDAGVTTATLIFWAATDADPASFAPFDSDEVDFDGTALTVDGVAGQYWLTVDLRTQYISGTPITILFPGVLIATQPWVTEQIADGGGGAVTPTPPVVLVDGAAYTAHGGITIAGWRDYDFVQFLYTNGTTTYQAEPVNSVQLIARSPIQTSLGRNVALMLTIDATEDDVITLAFTSGNGVPAPSASSTMTVIGW